MKRLFYLILLSGLLFQANFSYAQPMPTDPLLLFIDPLTVQPGDRITVNVEVQNFVQVAGIQGSIEWTSNGTLSFAGFNEGPQVPATFFVTPGLPGQGNIASNQVTFSGFNLSTLPVDLNDGEILLQLAFDVIGSLGSFNEISIQGSPTALVYAYVSSGNDFPITPSSAIISVGSSFPVTWASFEAEVQPDRSVALDWATAQEVNNDYFEVERRTAEGDFQAIGRMGGAGNADQETRYRFVDPQPFSGENYYRIRQVDFDGSFSYSEVQVANLQKSQWLQAYPNPVGTTLTLELPETAETFRLDWLDATGRVVRQDQLSGGAGAGEVSLEVSDLPAGVYQLRLQSPAGQVYLSSVVKQ